MKKIISIFAAAAIACASLVSCSDLSKSVSSLVGMLIGGDSSSDSSISGSSSSSHFIFVFMNNSQEDIYWFVPRKGGITEEMDAELKQYIHFLAADDLDPVMVTEDDGNPIWTYGANDSMPLYVFPAEVIDNYEWKDIVANKMWKTVFNLTADKVIEDSKIVAYN